MKKGFAIIISSLLALLLVSCSGMTSNKDLQSSSVSNERLLEKTTNEVTIAQTNSKATEESSTEITTSKATTTTTTTIPTTIPTTTIPTTVPTTTIPTTISTTIVSTTKISTTTTTTSNPDINYINVTVDELYSNPQKYNNQNVEVNGYITFYGLIEPYYDEHFYDICITTNRNSDFDVNMYNHLGLDEHDTGTLYIGFKETNTPYVNGRIKVSKIKSNMAGSPQIDASNNLRDYPIKVRGIFSYNPQDEHYIADPYTYQLDVTEYYLGR